jgi:hypothetical protein
MAAELKVVQYAMVSWFTRDTSSTIRQKTYLILIRVRQCEHWYVECIAAVINNKYE